MLKFKNPNKARRVDDITYEYLEKPENIDLFDMCKTQYKLFREKLNEKNWQEVAAELYGKNNGWLFKIITNQNRSDFLFLLDIEKNHLALDLGADWGQVAIPLSKFCDVIAVENNIEKVDIMKKIAEQEHRSNLQFVVANISDKIFEHEQFNLVIFNGVLELMGTFSNGNPIELQQDALNEAYQLLKPGGVLYMSIENKYDLKYILGERDDHTGFKGLVYLTRDTAQRIFEAETGKELRIFMHSKKEYENMLKKAGFQNIKFFGDLPNHKLPNVVIDLSNNSGPSFAAQNLDFVEEYEGSMGERSNYNEKLKYLYQIFSGEELINLYPSFSIIAKK